MRRALQCAVPTAWVVLLLGLPPLGWPPSVGAALPSAQAAPVTDTTFRHAKHQEMECRECHEMQPTHGAFLIQDVSDCRSCHHTKERVDYDCAECHAVADMREVVYRVQRTFTLTVGDDPSDRELSFKHADHEERECAECHEEGPSYSVPELDCQSCHEEHHAITTSRCTSCHQEPPEGAHPLAVHQTCSGSGCHQESPIESSPRSRVGCLWCHEDMADHEKPEEECTECHSLSDAGALSRRTMDLLWSWIDGGDSPRGLGGLPALLEVRDPPYASTRNLSGHGRG